MSTLDDIEARINAATEGPWEVEEDSVAVVAPALGLSDDGVRLAAVAEAVYTEADREFITHARADVPTLVALVRDIEALADNPRRLGTPYVFRDDIRAVLAKHLGRRMGEPNDRRK